MILLGIYFSYPASTPKMIMVSFWTAGAATATGSSPGYLGGTMVSFQRGQMDPQGNYRGTSYGCGVASILVFAGIFVTAILIGWPFMVLHGPVAWLVEVLYLVIAVPVGLLVMASRTSKREKP